MADPPKDIKIWREPIHAMSLSLCDESWFAFRYVWKTPKALVKPEVIRGASIIKGYLYTYRM